MFCVYCRGMAAKWKGNRNDIPNSPDIGVCRKAVQLCLDMLSSRTVVEVTAFFKKEISKTHEPANEKVLAPGKNPCSLYRTRSIASCSSMPSINVPSSFLMWLRMLSIH